MLNIAYDAENRSVRLRYISWNMHMGLIYIVLVK